MDDTCKYCNIPVVDLLNEGLRCESCEKFVHLSCLKRGSTPGALAGDVFFNFTCLECSDNNAECFDRGNTKWFYLIILAFYHLTMQHKALSRKGYFHWRMHVAMFIDKNWNVLFDKSLKQKKNWKGTISGLLSVHSSTFFTKCRTFNEQGWWTLTYPKLTPKVQVKLANELSALKASLKSQNITKLDSVLLTELLQAKNYAEEFTTMTINVAPQTEITNNSNLQGVNPQDGGETIDVYTPFLYGEDSDKPDKAKFLNFTAKSKNNKNKRPLLPTFDASSKLFDLDLNNASPRKKQKFSQHKSSPSWDEIATSSSQESTQSTDSKEDFKLKQAKIENGDQESIKFLDPLCHYNTSLNNLSTTKRLNLLSKLMGGLREETILSPYSNLYLKPYIHRDIKRTPRWLQLMAQIQLKVNDKVKDFILPKRAPIDYVYVQPSHIPAINSLCNQFFWPGIDLTECLQYPDFSCVVMYKKLIIGFAFIVPDVKIHENYISFIFVRPGWRNIGIGKFMIYHLIQTSMGKDITLHVAINNPGLFLYQKFGFKVEHVELNFYEKYLHGDSYESKHAFFCRLER